MRKQLSGFQGQKELLREEQQRVIKQQIRLEKKQQDLAKLREQLQRQEELLRKEQKRVLELQNQAEANQQDLARERKLHKEDRELLREEKRRVLELQSQLESKQQDFTIVGCYGFSSRNFSCLLAQKLSAAVGAKSKN